MTPAGVVRASGLSKTFEQEARTTEALRDVDFSIEPGTFVSLVGPSGCGKSTLLDILAGLRRPTSGDVEVGAAVGELGYMIQTDTLLPWARCVDNVALPLKFKGVARRARREAAAAVMDRVGLGGFESSFPAQLSGGMRKRAQIARLVLQEPSVVFMDEPFSALDAQTRMVVQEEFLALWSRERPTVLLITHDLQEAIFLSDRVLVMGTRPGTIIGDHRVTLPRPRAFRDVIKAAEYTSVFDAIWAQLSADGAGTVAVEAGRAP